MKNFSNVFRNQITSSYGSLGQNIGSTVSSTILRAVKDLQTHLSTNSGQVDSFIGAMTADADMIADEFVEKAEVSYDEASPLFTEVAPEVADDVVEGMSDFIHNGEESIAFVGSTITDSTGRAYNVIDQRSNNVVIDGERVLYSATLYPSKKAEAILTQEIDTGKVHLNNFIRSSDFVSETAHRVVPEGVFALAQSVAIITTGSSAGTIAGNVRIIVGAEVSSIFEDLSQWATNKGIDIHTADDIASLLLIVWHWANLQYPLAVGKGVITPIWQLVQHQVESAELNSYITEACSIVTSATDKATAVTALVNKSGSSKFSSVRQFTSAASHAFTHGGFLSLAGYILSYVKELLKAKDKGDGTFGFTDNSRFVPQIYLSGIISTILTVAGAVVNALVAIFSPIIGAAFSLIGAVFSSVIKSISYDSRQANGALQTDERVVYPIAPYGILQGEVNVEEISNYDVRSLFSQGEPFQCFSIPGGMCMFGPGSFKDDGSVKTVRFELHPSIENSDFALGSIISTLISERYIQGIATTVGSGESAYDLLRVAIPEVPLQDRENLRKWICSRWSYLIADQDVANESDSLLSDENDLIVRRRIMGNSFLMVYYCSLFVGTSFVRSMPGYYGLFALAHQNAQDEWVQYIPSTPLAGGYRSKNIFSGILMYSGGAELYVTEGQGPYYMTTVEFDDDWIDWTDTASIMSNTTLLGRNSNSCLALVNYVGYLSSIEIMVQDSPFAIVTPKYDRKSFWATLISSLILTAVVATTVTIATVKTKNSIRKKRAVNEARVAKAYENLTQNPSDENYMAYRKAVKKNNRWATLLGGSKYDLESYWHGPTNVEGSGQQSGSSVNPFNVTSVLSADNEASEVASDDSITTTGGFNDIKKLITGIY